MKRITLYRDEAEGNNTDYLEDVFLAECHRYVTKRELLENQNKLRMERDEYERRHQTFLSEERKRAWLN